MNAINTALRIFFLSQIIVGTVGNSFFFCLYIITFLFGPKLRPIDLLFSHLAFVNDLVLLSKGIPQTMSTFGLKNFLDDVGCKLVFYLHRVARSLSRSTTCLLTGFQAITISSGSYRWTEFKEKFTKFIVPSCLFCWTFHLLINIILLMYIRGPKGSKNTTEIHDFIYCSFSFQSSFGILMYVFIFSLPDIICVGIIVSTSIYMVFALKKHFQTVKYVHGSSVNSRVSPEPRATQTILLLVSTFVTFYSLNSILAVYMHYRKSQLWMVHMSVFLAACFPACSPFVLIISDSQVPKYCLVLWRKIRPPP
ncbi:vomeronasal type-1 receptor 1-like [Dromiciops gliroides]|uniref:vomeronasal type-1 receptor 1-like n=1 Tax=Dromiciops gliroides TaxID=33562 RepID=UPI001CC35203|nr:vomeronasal type-1 receptor 1-like [Dromiciops gliroides]